MSEQANTIRNEVKSAYGEIAANNSSCCGPACCTPDATRGEAIGYSMDELGAVPEDANLGLGCGNPTAIAGLAPGEVVVDLGSGPGLDAFLAAKKVGESGRVIGVDMTPEMLQRARNTAANLGVAGYVEFREGVIEELPIASSSVDVIISNCVINLSPEKDRVFAEAFRVLKPGGRLAISDLVIEQALPPEILGLAEAYIGCIAGALTFDDYRAKLEAAGFTDITWTKKSASPMFAEMKNDPIMQQALGTFGEEKVTEIAEGVFSYTIEARRP